ncbi:MAG: ParB/RepB/Spo0J family partition protein [Candidatus Paracaedibacteraceae bacterium]|nr:ParB/RepB/Spo0J family partition protein [Candidatus Paracaedibacteraceae bacterium]
MTNLVGKGLAALLGDIAESAREIESGKISPHNRIYLNQITPGRLQPRKAFDPEKLSDLVDSIRKNGVLQPIVVRKVADQDYEIIAGERRWRASETAGLETIPAVVLECTDAEALQIGLIENLQRDDLNPMEEAEAFLRLANEHHQTQEEIALAVSKSRSYVANQMRLNNLSGHLKQLVRDRRITPGHARNLINDPNAEETANRIMNEGLNVRQTEAIRQGKIATQKSPENADAAALAQQLQETLGLRTKIITNQHGGAVTFYFNSYDQLDELIQKLSI